MKIVDLFSIVILIPVSCMIVAIQMNTISDYWNSEYPLENWTK